MAKTNKQMIPEEKKEVQKEEKTHSARYYTPVTDIYETEKDMVMFMDVPGVAKEKLSISLEKGILEVEGQIGFGAYEELKPVHVEYNVGHFNRRFQVPDMIDKTGITASVNDGVLKLVLPKQKQAMPKQIKIG